MAGKKRPSRSQCNSKKKNKTRKNPFFNFLRELRSKHPDWPSVKISVEGGRKWSSLTPDQRKKYEAVQVEKSPRSFEKKNANKRKYTSCKKKQSGKKMRKPDSHGNDVSGTSSDASSSSSTHS